MNSDRPSSPQPLHVVVYTDSTGMGGAEISLGHLVGHVSEQINITVVGVSDQVVEAIAKNRPQSSRIVLPSAGLSAFIAHLNTFQYLNPDIIHINLCVPWACTIALTTALLLPGKKVVRVDQLPLRTTDARDLWLTRLLSLRVDAHVAVGQASAQRMEDFYALGRNTILSIPNGVPDFPFEAPVPRFDDRLFVGSIGRLDAMKGHDVLLRAIAQVEGVEAIIIGEGDQRPTLEHLAEALGIQNRVQLPGWADNPRSYLSQVDVIAMPSRSEGFPLAMVEAMLAARPVIATCVGSMPEAIHPEMTGLLIEKNDVEGLAAALRKLRDDPLLRIQMGKQARAIALENYTAERMARRYEEEWQQLQQRPPKPRFKIPRPKD